MVINPGFTLLKCPSPQGLLNGSLKVLQSLRLALCISHHFTFQHRGHLQRQMIAAKYQALAPIVMVKPPRIWDEVPGGPPKHRLAEPAYSLISTHSRTHFLHPTITQSCNLLGFNHHPCQSLSTSINCTAFTSKHQQKASIINHH